MQKFETPSPVTVVLDIPAGRVRLVASERSDACVEVAASDVSKKRDVRALEQTTVEFVDGVLRVVTAEASRVLGSSGSLEVSIEVPAGSRVEGKAGAAELYGTGALGDVRFEGGYRSVEIEQAASARLKVHSGRVSVARLAGSAWIENGQGEVTIGEAVEGELVVRTGTGDVTVGAARGVSATLDASTGSGRIRNALQNSAGAGAGLRIEASTGHGDITTNSL